MSLRHPIRRLRRLAWVALGAALCGCGTTRWSDTTRTATEQLLISDATDRAVSQIDFGALAGKDVYLETRFISGSVDEKYLVSTLRQHMLATGCIIKDKPEEAGTILEVRAGAVGTNRNDLLFGVPATSLPAGGMFPLVPTSIPEIPLMKRTNQQGVCKVAVFAYDRRSGRPIWQSGTMQVASKAKDTWVLGTGPFQQGTIYAGTKFAGEHLQVPLAALDDPKKKSEDVPVSHEIFFSQPPQIAAQESSRPPQQSASAPTQPGAPEPWPLPMAPGTAAAAPRPPLAMLLDPFGRSLVGRPPAENKPVGFFEDIRPPAVSPGLQPLDPQPFNSLENRFSTPDDSQRR